MTRVDLPKNKSKLCQTLSLCFWFGTTKWITKEIFRVHTASVALNLKQELNKLNRGPCQRFTFSIMGEGLSCLCLCILWLYRDNEATGVFPSCSNTVLFAILPSLLLFHPSPSPTLIPPLKKKKKWWWGELFPERANSWREAYTSMGSAYFNQNILNSWTLLFKALLRYTKAELISKSM